MLLRKKPMFGANIQPACTYCEFGQKAADPRMILCAKRGVVSPYYQKIQLRSPAAGAPPPAQAAGVFGGGFQSGLKAKNERPPGPLIIREARAGVLFCLSVAVNYRASPSLACSSVSSCSGVWLTKLT